MPGCGIWQRFPFLFFFIFPSVEPLRRRVTTEENIAEAIKSELRVLGLDMRNCRGQGYDGAGNMSGKYSGTAVRIQNEFPDAVYDHCASHRLNLCVANACSIQSIRNTFGTMKVVHDFFNWPKRLSLLEGKISAVYTS